MDNQNVKVVKKTTSSSKKKQPDHLIDQLNKEIENLTAENKKFRDLLQTSVNLCNEAKISLVEYVKRDIERAAEIFKLRVEVTNLKHRTLWERICNK